MSNVKDEIFSHLGRQFWESINKSNEKGQDNALKDSLVIVGILAFTGYEAVKVLFRKNYTLTTLGIVRLVLCFLCFVGISIISFYCIDSTDNFAQVSASSRVHIFSTGFFAILAAVVLIKGFVSGKKVQGEEYNGDSNVLAFLKWKKPIIQNFAEPALVLTIGITYLFFDYLAGGALIFCALSVWFNMVFEMFFSTRSMEDNVKDLNKVHDRKTKFNKVNID